MAQKSSMGAALALVYRTDLVLQEGAVAKRGIPRTLELKSTTPASSIRPFGR